ncbi:MAG: hypothetical protein PVH24_02170 [Candidatus Zixiibacteriota bacterium]
MDKLLRQQLSFDRLPADGVGLPSFATWQLGPPREDARRWPVIP